MKRAPGALLASVFFLFATVLFTWPQALRLSGALTDLWDAKHAAWILHWDYAQTFRDPLNLFHAKVFHPSSYALAFSENLYGAALFGFPLFAGGFSPLTVYNILFLLGMFLSALSAWGLARYVTGDPAASAIAGLVYAFVPWRISHLPHIHLQWGGFLPLIVLFLLRYFDHGRRRDAIWAGVFFAWNALTSVYYGLYSALLILLVLLYEALVCESRDRARRFRGSLLALAVASLAAVPFYVPYRKAAQLYGFQRGYEEVHGGSARPLDFLVAGTRFYSPLTQRWARPERDLFPGLVPLLLAGYLLARPESLRREGRRREIPARRRTLARVLDLLIFAASALGIAAAAIPGLVIGPLKLRDPGRALVFVSLLILFRLVAAFPRGSRYHDLRDFLGRMRIGSRPGLFVAIGALGLLLALGGNTPFYRFLFQSLGPFFRAIRVPARGIVVFHIGLAVLAACGLKLLRRRAGSPIARRGWTAAAFLAIGFEYRAFPVWMAPVETEPPPVYRWLGKVQLPGAVLEWPLGGEDVEYMFRSTVHGHPLINGYSSFFPSHYIELAWLLDESPIPDAVWDEIRRRDGALLIYHAHDFENPRLSRYRGAVKRALEARRIEAVATFPHGGSRDYAFRIATAPPFDSRLSRETRRRAALEAERHFR